MVKMTESNYQKLVEKWGPILEHESFSPIADKHRKSVTASILENTERALVQEGDASVSMTSLLSEAPANATGAGIDNYDPVLISLIRRSMPNLIALAGASESNDVMLTDASPS
jgi:hypothetical protein